MNDGKVSPPVGIFMGKNYDGLRDESEQKITVTPGEEYKSAEQLEKKYLEASEVGSLPVIETTAEETPETQNGQLSEQNGAEQTE